MSDPIAAAEAAGKARDIANRFETAVFLIAYGIAEKDGLYEADPHRYPYSQAFRHGMNILAALCAECSDDAEELLPTFNESDFIRNSAASDVREWTARWRDECREAVEGCRSIEIGPLASVDGDYFAATSECYEVLRFAENDLLGGHQERRVYEFLRAGTQEQYAYGRRMLIRHPLLTWNEYVRIKTGLALGDPDPLDQGEADTIDPVWLQEFVSMAYEPVPGAAKVCPNCGWTMTMRGKQPHCSSATCAKAVTGDFDKLDSVAHDAFRLSRGVMHYISSPGKLELAIAEAAAGLGLKYEMWPLKDTCDILIHLPDGRQLAVDAKAYGRAERLAREIEDDTGIAQMCADEVAYVVPDQTGKIDDIPRKSRRPPIDITLDELISTADEVGEKTGKTHYAAVLRRVKDQGLLKRARGGSTSVADDLRLDEVVSLVGLVGAGKSVLANMLIVCLAKRGLRAVSLLNSVSDVMESVVLLREAGISASPLVSRGRRIERLDEFFDHDDSMLLDHSASKYLETACIMDGLSSSDPEACGYGSTPCRGLRSKKGGANSCPYWDVCPSQAMARESLTSDVVVTTPTGFATMIVGRERKAFFEEALQQFDVVLFDEADRVQAQLDGCFAPSMSFQELIRNAADPTAVAMKRRPDDKMRDFNEELFYDLRQKSEPVAKALLKSVRDDRVAKWRIVKDEAFTSLSLLNDLLEQGLPKQVYEDADKLINPYRFEIAKKSLDGGDAALNKLSQAVATSCEGIDDDTHSYSLNEYLAACGCSELPDELRTRFSFALKVIRFDSYLRELASAQDLLSFKDDSVDELYNFLKFSYTRQQHYLPNSLIGNIFGMKLDGNDLRLFRQFAFGRAFMCSLPWLDTDPAGAALGPHVLLLSGSSWEPGCLQYHVNRPVDYLLEAEPWKAAKLSTSTVRDLGIEQNVSGSAAEIRSGNLGIVLSQTMATLKDELDADGAGKALVIVNSYREAEDARDRIEQEFRRKGQAIKVAALVRNNHDHREHFVPRSEVYKFCDHPAKVLVAPAMAIERGFNIVDRGGHAVFTSLIFSVRPMGTPHDLGGRYRKLNGLIEREVGDYPANPGEFATEVRASAWRTWKTMERDENLPMGAWRTMGRQFLVDDAISTLMVTIIQIFGRLARLADKERPAPHVYFADAAFRGGDGKLSFRTLEELGAYMERLMHDSDQPEVAKALYGPFYESFRKGIGNVGL